MRARLPEYILILLFSGGSRESTRMARPAEVNNVISAIDRLLQTLQLPAGTLPTEQMTMFVKNPCYYTQINSANPAAAVWNNVGFFIKWSSYSWTLVAHR